MPALYAVAQHAALDAVAAALQPGEGAFAFLDSWTIYLYIVCPLGRVATLYMALSLMLLGPRPCPAKGRQNPCLERSWRGAAEKQDSRTRVEAVQAAAKAGGIPGCGAARLARSRAASNRRQGHPATRPNGRQERRRRQIAHLGHLTRAAAVPW